MTRLLWYQNKTVVPPNAIWLVCVAGDVTAAAEETAPSRNEK